MSKLICPVCNGVFERCDSYLEKLKTEPTCSNQCRSILARRKAQRHTEKRCTQCGKTKPLDTFYDKVGIHDGKTGSCKACIRQQAKKYREQNPGKVQKSKKRYYEQHREEILARDKKHYEKNKNEILQQAAQYREEHREEIRQWHCEYRRQNLKKRRAKDRRYYRENRTKALERSREYRQRPEVHRRIIAKNRLYKANKQSLPNSFTETDWQYALDYWHGCCAVCERPPGFWHKIVMDHWIPISDPKCPGTIPSNIIPLCHGVGGCNNNKHSQDPEDWITQRLGEKAGRKKLLRIKDYLQSLA